MSFIVTSKVCAFEIHSWSLHPYLPWSLHKLSSYPKFVLLNWVISYGKYPPCTLSIISFSLCFFTSKVERSAAYCIEIVVLFFLSKKRLSNKNLSGYSFIRIKLSAIRLRSSEVNLRGDSFNASLSSIIESAWASRLLLYVPTALTSVSIGCRSSSQIRWLVYKIL